MMPGAFFFAFASAFCLSFSAFALRLASSFCAFSFSF
jgi:hypothetical protein